MSDSLITIYRASAGSGKTRTLAKSYLKLALSGDKDVFKKILAVTFTNKATQEMKERILHYLSDFVKGNDNIMAKELADELGVSVAVIRSRAKEVLSGILHNYSRFNISTIDAFFQKIIRSFAREAGLSGDYSLELDHKQVISKVIDEMIKDVGKNESLTNWVLEFSKDNLFQDKAWDIRYSLKDFSNEIFKEEFKLIEDNLLPYLSDAEFVSKLAEALHSQRDEFLNSIKTLASDVLADFQSLGLSGSDFKYAGGIYNFFVKCRDLDIVKSITDKNIGSRVRNDFQEAENWGDKKSKNFSVVTSYAADKGLSKLQSILSYRDEHFKNAISIEMMLNHFFAFGLVAQMTRKLREYKVNNNLMLISDASKMLQSIIKTSDTPFIYEKIGTQFDHFLIDEFQDTSLMQWENFKPLLQESIDRGKHGMLVGDVKQSIYRWRGGDLTLLQSKVQQDLGSHNVSIKDLDSNYRSLSNVIAFNNHLYTTAVRTLNEKIASDLIFDSYQTVIQKPTEKQGGLVELRFFSDKGELTWQELALQRLIQTIELLQDKGAKLSDIAILVRKNAEGVLISNYLSSYSQELPQSKYRYDLVSSESLLLSSSISCQCIVSVLRMLISGRDTISRGELLTHYTQLKNETMKAEHYLSIHSKELLFSFLPKGFSTVYDSLPYMSLYEMVESIVTALDLFGLAPKEFAFIETFQNLVLEFNGKDKNDLFAFIDFWEESGKNKSVNSASGIDAIQLLSVHKSKGLQFKHVIIPFAQWDNDHSPVLGPTLWVESGINNVSLPVKYSSTLKESNLEQAYNEEYTRSILDSVNLLYVATTRAEHNLFMFCPEQIPDKTEKTIAGVMYDSLLKCEAFNGKITDGCFQYGELSVQETKVAKRPLQRLVNRSANWRNVIAIKPFDNGIESTSIIDNENYQLDLFTESGG